MGYYYRNDSSTLYSLCLTGYFVTQSAPEISIFRWILGSRLVAHFSKTTSRGARALLWRTKMYRLLAAGKVLAATARAMCTGASATVRPRPIAVHPQVSCGGIADNPNSAKAFEHYGQKPRSRGASTSVRTYAAPGAEQHIVEPGPPPPVALVSFRRPGGAGAAELGLVENGQWLWAGH